MSGVVADPRVPAVPSTAVAAPSLLGMRPEDLAPRLVAAGVVGASRALRVSRQVLAHVVSHGNPHLPQMKQPPSRRVQAWLEAHTRRERLAVVERVPDPEDGSVRYLFAHPDGVFTEAVRIPLEKPGHYSVCLSSQAGCAMKCAFCATGRLGLSRNLAAWEMVAAWLTVRDEAPGRVTGAVFMGQGEPLHNYDAVIQAAHVLRDPCGGRISAKAISISTVGLVPRIHRYARERQPFRLITSLTSADPERRRALLPVAGRWSLDELADALRALHRAQGGRVTVAWVLMGGVNTGADEALKLRALLGDIPLRVNLIDVNSAGAEGRFVRADDAERDAFFDALQILGAPVVRRYSVGRSEQSACGMLAATRADGTSVVGSPPPSQPSGDAP